jgi:hypothetical protein
MMRVGKAPFKGFEKLDPNAVLRGECCRVGVRAAIRPQATTRPYGPSSSSVNTLIPWRRSRAAVTPSPATRVREKEPS